MKLVNVYEDNRALEILYALMKKRPRESWISHAELPAFSDHVQFVASRLFRYWYMIEHDDVVCGIIGAIQCTQMNEVGIELFPQWRGKGLGRQAMELFFATHKPLPPIPAIRSGSWLANIAIGNESSKAFFKSLDFKPTQETWKL